MCFLVDLFKIWLKADTKLDSLLHDFLTFLAIAPDFVWLSCVEVASAVVDVRIIYKCWNVMWISVAVKSHDWEEYAHFEPSLKKLYELWIIYVTIHESTDICGPP